MNDDHTQQLVSQATRWRQRLLHWYRQNHRKMPWRAEPGKLQDAYYVLVSEAMLQQTQVATVIPYYKKFLKRFPTLASLAAASEQDVLALWQGLGYYRRARHLHQAAKAIMQEYGGKIPTKADALIKLPGIGRYTAGAIASIAFGERVAVMDGNVVRVLSRVAAINEPVQLPPTQKKLWALAEQLVPQKTPGDYNQAMMELGATVCTPAQPKCAQCPVQGLCAGYAAGEPTRWPVQVERKPPREVVHVMLAVQRADGAMLFVQRPAKGLWANMWQWPTRESPKDKAHEDWLKSTLGISTTPLKKQATFTHQTTHRTICFEVWGGMISQRVKQQTLDLPHVWRNPTVIDDLPVSNAQRKAMTMLKNT